MKPTKAASTLVAALVLLAGCGSTSATDTADSTDSTASTVPERRSGRSERVVHQNLATVAVAGDTALVADGALPTGFSLARLDGDEAKPLEAVGPPVDLVSRATIGFDDEIVVIGNRCDEGVKSDGIENRCEPGTPTAVSYWPDTGTWDSLKIDADLDGVRLSGAIAQRTGPSTATVIASADADDPSESGLRLFTVDTKHRQLTAHVLPADARPGP